MKENKFVVILQNDTGRVVMRFFSYKTSLTIEEIQERGAAFLTYEQHSPWNIFKEYYSTRNGLHLYITRNGFKGYYEDGERNRQGSLNRAKLWINIKIKEKRSERIIEGYIYPCTFLAVVILLLFIEFVCVKDVFSFVIILAMLALFIFLEYKDERDIIELVKSIFLIES